MPKFYLVQLDGKKKLMTESGFWLAKEWYDVQPDTPEHWALRDAESIEAENKKEAACKLGLLKDNGLQ